MKILQSEGHDDRARDAILRILHGHLRSSRGMRRTGLGFRDICTRMKERGGFKQQDVARNLPYLIDIGWVVEDVQNRAFTTPQGTLRSAEQRRYRLSAQGIEHFEGASVYSWSPTKIHGVNVSAINSVVALGEGNVINANLTGLARDVAKLMEGVQGDATLTDEQRLECLVDLATMQTQLSRPHPAPAVLGTVWKSVEAVSIAAGLIPLVEAVRNGLHATGLL